MITEMKSNHCENHGVILRIFEVSRSRKILRCINCDKEIATWESN